MTELEKKVQSAAQAYYTDGSSKLSDDEFDDLIEQLRAEQPNSDLLNKVGWGYDVNKDTTPGEKYKHKYGEAGSLSKAYNWNEINNIYKYESVDISAKLDGLSVVLYYENGYLIQALTRGDGITGIDITDKVRCIIGTHISDEEFTGAVRGEIVMSHKNFEDYKLIHPEAKNARNTAVGLINGKSITTDFRFLNIVTYSIVGVGQKTLLRMLANCGFVPMTYVRNWLRNNFRKTAPSKLLILGDTSELPKLFEQWSEEYPIDGLVISEKSLRFKNMTPQQISQAYKFKSETAQSKVVEVEWNVSKTGYFVPRVKIEPVQLSGTTVQYCTGENAKNIIENKIGVGAIVEVEKHGEIIPNINAVITPATDINVPKVCPYCNKPLELVGVHLTCTNLSCTAASYFDTMIWTDTLAPVDNLGRKLKQQFFMERFGSVPLIEDLMRDPYKRFNSAVEGTQLYRMKQMFDKLHGSSKIKLVDAITALNIPRFGEINASKLAKYPNCVLKLIDLASDGSCTQFNEILDIKTELTKNIGQANADSIIEHLWKFERLTFIKHRIDWNIEDTSETDIKGKVAITGKLSVKRSVFEEELKNAGYVVGNISKDTKFLITDNPNSSSSKNKKADELGIIKITESEFRKGYM